ncbi:HNHc domain containing protein [uncultured Caudovirales phage]|uniref:HNHc domain containing protein n=1 Tax=uncultured Caudovirales phage TaxID=2100421 RepID=A0A6J5NRI3_9CAUD|nr:HNHc domain containing protein [uncultured Caudovirales phage]
MTERAINSGKWKKLRITVLDRDGWQCVRCNKPAHTVDHIIPRVKGGDMWALDNLQSMCKSCNSSKGDRFFSHKATPPVFLERSLPETVRVVPESPFSKPEIIQFDAG